MIPNAPPSEEIFKIRNQSTKMKIVEDFPPNIDALRLVFPITNTVIFAWGDKIYNPHKVDIPDELIAHEMVHGARQLKMGVNEWWVRYIEDPAFRLAEEVPAHQAEFTWLMKNANRKERRSALKVVSNKLAAPLYGKLITPKQAQKIIKEALDG